MAPATGHVARAEALRRLLESARQRDAFTLISLFRRASANERGLIFDRLDELVPAPAGITRDAVVAGTTEANPWWTRINEVLGLSAIRKKGPLGVDLYNGIAPNVFDEETSER